MPILEVGIQILTNKSTKGFTLLEALIALGILAFVMSAAIKIFTSNAITVSKLEEKAMARFVADNILVSTFFSENELYYASGTRLQAGKEYSWERTITYGEDGRSTQINISVSDLSGNTIYNLYGFKVSK